MIKTMEMVAMMEKYSDSVGLLEGTNCRELAEDDL
jgi:hypothetical protein